METVRRSFRYIVPAAICGFVAVCWWWGGGFDKVMAANHTGRQKAADLVAAYAKHAGAHDSAHQTLDADNDRSFGDFGFHYYPEKDLLRVRVYYIAARLKGSTPQHAANLRKCVAGLNSPQFGGMYDRGGGFFYLDEQKDIVFLAKDYPLSNLDPNSFMRDVDNLRDLGALWVMSWGAHAADQIFGHETPPTHFVDRQHNPYGKHY